MLGNDVKLEGFGENAQEFYTKEQEEAMLKEAVEAAKEADTVVLFLGEDRLQSGEATSRGILEIPAIQQRLLDEVAKVNSKIAVVLFSGRPLDLRKVEAKAKSILEVWMPGTCP